MGDAGRTRQAVGPGALGRRFGQQGADRLFDLAQRGFLARRGVQACHRRGEAWCADEAAAGDQPVQLGTDGRVVCLRRRGGDARALEQARADWRRVRAAGLSARYWAQEQGRWVQKSAG